MARRSLFHAPVMAVQSFAAEHCADIKQVLEKLSAGQTIDAIQPLLRMPGESRSKQHLRFLVIFGMVLFGIGLNLFLQLLHRLSKNMASLISSWLKRLQPGVQQKKKERHNGSKKERKRETSLSET